MNSRKIPPSHSQPPQPRRPQTSSPRIVVIQKQSSLVGTVALVGILIAFLAAVGAFVFRNSIRETPVALVPPPEPTPIEVPPEAVVLAPVKLPEIITDPESGDSAPAQEPDNSGATPDPAPDTAPVAKPAPKAPDAPAYVTKLRPATSIQRRSPSLASALDKEVWVKLNATREHPVPVPPDREKITQLVERYMKTPANQVVANPLAATFPGPVPASAPRVIKTVTLPANLSGWQSTGLYAPPGELIRVHLGSQDLKRGVSIQIGCHSDSLLESEEIEAWQRFPVLTTHVTASRGTTQIASPFGGLIYICTPGGPPTDKARIRADITGAVEAPFYKLGETTKAEWELIRNAPAPWGELSCRTITLSVPSGLLRTLDDPEKLMRVWEKIIDDQDWLAALPKRTTRPERLVPDVQISLGYMHSGYPVMCHAEPSAKDMVDVHHLTTDGDWGFFHEYGHNHQRGEWTFSGFGETTCNLFALYNMETTAGKPRGEGSPDLAHFLAEKLADPKGATASDHYLAIYLPVLREFGWESLRKTFAEYDKINAKMEKRMKNQNSRSHSKRKPKDGGEADDAKADEQNKETFVRLWSKHTKRNLGPYFEKVGFPYTSAMKSSLSLYKPWMPPEVSERSSGASAK